MTDTSEYATIVANVLLAQTPAERHAALDAYPPSIIAAAFFDAILEIVHPSSLTIEFSDIVRAHVPDEDTITRAVAAISDEDLMLETRAACLRAIGGVEGLDEWVFPDMEKLYRMYVRWEQAAREAPDGWWDHTPPEEITQPMVAAQRTGFFPMSEFEIRREIELRARTFHDFIVYAFEPGDLDKVEVRLRNEDAAFVTDALVHAIFVGEPADRELFLTLCMTVGEPTPLAQSRATAAVCDPTCDWDLRVTCLLVLTSDPMSHGIVELRRIPPFSDIPTHDWERLSVAAHQLLALWCWAVPPVFASIAQQLSLAQFEAVCVELRTRGYQPDWEHLLHQPHLSYLWPRVAEELAFERATSAVDLIAECATRVHGAEGFARMMRALLRLRTM